MFNQSYRTSSTQSTLKYTNKTEDKYSKFYTSMQFSMPYNDSFYRIKDRNEKDIY